MKRGYRETPTPADPWRDPVFGKLIVVVDDDALVRESMQGLLQDWGCRVIAAASKHDALTALARGDGNRPDLIISDYRLAQGETGVELIDHMRQALGGAIPAFLISGDTAPERLRESLASGCQLLHKPVDPMALRAMLSRFLKDGRSGEQASPNASS